MNNVLSCISPPFPPILFYSLLFSVAPLRGGGGVRTALGDTIQGDDTLMKVKQFLRLNYVKVDEGGGSGDVDVKKVITFWGRWLTKVVSFLTKKNRETPPVTTPGDTNSSYATVYSLPSFVPTLSPFPLETLSNSIRRRVWAFQWGGEICPHSLGITFFFPFSQIFDRHSVSLL